MTEEQKRKKRERERERQNSIAQSNLVEEVTPKILFLDTKPLFWRMRYFK